jgi:SSS family solute:Na+ symporter
MTLAVLLLLYALLLVALGVFVSRSVRSSGDFFVAGRALPGWLVFSTLLAANIGAGSTVGAAGLGYRHGLSAWWWSGSAAIGSVVLGLVVAPRLHRLAAERGFLTVGDFLEARFDASVRGIVAALLCAGSLSILAGQIIAMAWAFQVVLGLSKPVGCLLAGLALVAYFSRGGLVASTWVNLLELAVLLVGFALALPFAWSAAGGWEALRSAAGPTPDYGTFSGMGWSAIAGLSLILVPSFIVSPGLVQKTYGARTAAAARGAVLANALALAVFAFIPALLGMCARAMRPNLGHAELALPVLMTEVLPPWLGGLALAALFAAEISTADAVLFMLSTSFSRDVYQRFLRPGADDRQLLSAGRWTSAISGFAGIVLAVLLPSVVDALKTFYGIMTVALFVPLLGGVLLSRPKAGRARAAILAGTAAMALCLVLSWGSPLVSWLPSAAGIGLAAAVFVWPALEGGSARHEG